MAEPERQEAPAERLEPAEATAETIESAEPRELESDVAPIPGAGWELEALTTDAYTAPRVEEPVDEIAELLLDDVVGAAAAAAEPRLEEVVTGGRDDFPLDAFIVPAGTTPPRGYDSDVAHMVAHRLDELARQLRSDGLSALGSTTSIDELSRVLAAIVTGYIAHHA